MLDEKASIQFFRAPRNNSGQAFIILTKQQIYLNGDNVLSPTIQGICLNIFKGKLEFHDLGSVTLIQSPDFIDEALKIKLNDCISYANDNYSPVNDSESSFNLEFTQTGNILYDISSFNDEHRNAKLKELGNCLFNTELRKKLDHIVRLSEFAKKVQLRLDDKRTENGEYLSGDFQ